MKPGWIFVAPALLIAAAPPPDAATKDDLRCFLIMGSLAGTAKEGPGMQTAVAGTLYFLGRLEDRAPALDIEAAGAAELLAMTEADFQKDKPRCLAVIEEKGKRLIAIGAAIDKRLKQAR
ncbi:MAG: hypothetical protein ABWX67_09915 [Allosphingosinicella sp.]